MGTWIIGSEDLPDPHPIAHSEQEDFGTDAWTASVQLKCAWEDRFETLMAILVSGLEWPYAPGSRMFVSTGSISTFQEEKVGSADNLNTYTHAILTINFKRSSNDEENEEEEIYSETIEDNGQLLKLPPRNVNDTLNDWIFKWGEDPNSAALTPEEAPTLLQMGMDYVVKWKNLSVIPAAVLSFKNHVNQDSQVSPSLGLTFPAETLLGTSAVLSRTTNAAFEVSGWDLELRWSHREEGWNKFWNPKTGAYEEIYIHGPNFNLPGTLYKNYPLMDMSGLLP